MSYHKSVSPKGANPVGRPPKHGHKELKRNKKHAEAAESKAIKGEMAQQQAGDDYAQMVPQEDLFTEVIAFYGRVPLGKSIAQSKLS